LSPLIPPHLLQNQLVKYGIFVLLKVRLSGIQRVVGIMNPFFLVITKADLAWIEVVYWIAGIIVAVAVVFGLKQVRAAIGQAKAALEQNRLSLEQIELSRKDIMLRSKREALALAIKECEYWANEIVPCLDKLNIKLNNIKYVATPLTNTDFPPVEKPHESAVRVWNDLPLRTEVVSVLNKMEAFAMYFATDLATEDAAFLPTGGPFCRACRHLSVFIGAYRQDNQVKLYNNIVKLYGIWAPRAELAVLQNQEQALQAQKSKLTQSKPRAPLGTEPL
jgi:hypothetical protein